ncbi:MAG: HEPN domain-containing protein [candidate division KSB1 bacterium]
MTEEKKQDLRQWLHRAQETLTEARTLKDAGLYIGTANRLYYACFYAASALLETRGLNSSKHSGIIALLNQHFVKAGLVSGDHGTFYRYLFDARQSGDYNNYPIFTAEKIAELFNSATEFVDVISRLTEGYMAES